MDEKRMPLMNFKIEKPKIQRWNLKKLLKYSISIHKDFNHQLAHRDIKQAL